MLVTPDSFISLFKVTKTGLYCFTPYYMSYSTNDIIELGHISRNPSHITGAGIQIFSAHLVYNIMTRDERTQCLRLRIPTEEWHNLIIPYHTNGFARCKRAEVISVWDKEQLLTAMEAEKTRAYRFNLNWACVKVD